MYVRVNIEIGIVIHIRERVDLSYEYCIESKIADKWTKIDFD